MSTTYRNSATANTGANAALSLTINTPSGIQPNDILLACITTNGTPTHTPPAGWTLAKSQSGSSSIKMSVYQRLTIGNEAASYQWTFGSSEQASGIIIAYSGTDTFGALLGASTSNGTSTASLVSGSLNNTWSGSAVIFYGAQNATASSTITGSSGYAVRADTCTTASEFVETAVQDKSRGLPWGGNGGQTVTCSQTATAYVTISMPIQDSHINTPLCIDNSSGTGFAAVASQGVSYISNYPNELLVALIAIETGTVTVSSITGGSLTWTKITSVTTQGGDCEAWYAFSPAAFPSGISFTVNFSGTAANGTAAIQGFANVDMSSGNGSSAIGASNTANGATSSQPTVNLTSTRNNSWTIGICNSANFTGLSSAGTNCTALHTRQDASSSSIFL
ncbi:MAG TPA: hypothetical protein VGS28_00300, partial [Candidatus Saccharimonadales bacterium]|nr:hypothetical protein [Candidatus Saccharimonadales bacterium]